MCQVPCCYDDSVTVVAYQCHVMGSDYLCTGPSSNDWASRFLASCSVTLKCLL